MQTEVLLKLCNMFYKQASGFEVPPDFLNTVVTWAQKVYAAHVYRYAYDKGINAYIESEKPVNVNNKQLQYQLHIEMKEMRDIVNACKAISPIPARKIRQSVSSQFPIQTAIDNWKYLNDEDKNTSGYMLEEYGWPDFIPVIFHLQDSDEDVGGYWHPTEKKIEIFCGVECDTLYMFKESLADVTDLITHEIQHMCQDLLKNLKILPHTTGIPSHTMRWTDTHTPEGEGLSTQHETLPADLIDIEFYPRLKQSISQFLRALPYESDKKGFFKFWIGINPDYEPDNPDYPTTSEDSPYYPNFEPDEFFESLRKNEHLKWQKAVKELWKNFHPASPTK